MGYHVTTLRLSILLSLFLIPQLALALQVTPNSPCAAQCQDSSTVDVSDPNSSTTKNSDIVCQDAKYSGPAGTKFKTCMSCLQTSGFSQGSESDIMWFLYNARYAAAYCVFGYPNATDIGSSPCTTSHACGPLKDSVEHGILNQKDMTAYSYCSAGQGEAHDPLYYSRCRDCVSAERKSLYLVNLIVALEAGCKQQPAPSVLLGLNETVFTDHVISIVDPSTIGKTEEKSSGMGTAAIAGIVGGAVVGILVIAAVTFICVRKRKNRTNRASAQADFFRSFGQRPESAISFQCQTHSMLSPRLWSAAAEGMSPVVEDPNQILPVYTQSSYQKQEVYGSSQYQQQNDTSASISKKAAEAAVPLHVLTTSIPPAQPPQAYTTPYAAEKVYYSPSDFKSPLSADSVRSTSALLPAIKPYVPSEHGVHGVHGSPVPQSATSFTSPSSGTGMTPLLKSSGWAEQQHQKQIQKPSRPTIKLTPIDTLPPPPPPGPAPKGGRNSIVGGIGLGLTVKKDNKSTPTGSPVESVEIKTAFKAPPRR
ncbi:hypothetical protein QBC38DRAFT_162764 [Podospora fimiseda]|uniref:LPXTG-domain-containing protein n=1 Tax=Podospora fimiseda TaxID=252190 RepID=A0AAN7BRI7_9PEZI|nr:hypothetical protein QBC38DRAFT_162764 [Podospora fimiseda]